MNTIDYIATLITPEIYTGYQMIYNKTKQKNYNKNNFTSLLKLLEHLPSDKKQYEAIRISTNIKLKTHHNINIEHVLSAIIIEFCKHYNISDYKPSVSISSFINQCYLNSYSYISTLYDLFSSYNSQIYDIINTAVKRTIISLLPLHLYHANINNYYPNNITIDTSHLNTIFTNILSPQKQITYTPPLTCQPPLLSNPQPIPQPIHQPQSQHQSQPIHQSQHQSQMESQPQLQSQFKIESQVQQQIQSLSQLQMQSQPEQHKSLPAQQQQSSIKSINMECKKESKQQSFKGESIDNFTMNVSDKSMLNVKDIMNHINNTCIKPPQMNYIEYLK
jgi:hypothetical protein